MISLAASVFSDAAQRTASDPARSDRRWTYNSQRSSIEMIEVESRKTGAERHAQCNHNIRQPAKNMSRWSCNTGLIAEANPFQPPQNSGLDPNGSAFEARAWTKAVLALRSKILKTMQRGLLASLSVILMLMALECLQATSKL